MDDQILSVLKRKLADLTARGEVDGEIQRNVLKEELQYYVLNFICHHPKYSNWIMYGGSALRICHGLNRMSVDLDFEINHVITDDFLDELKQQVEKHFSETYNTGPVFFTITKTKRGLILKFNIGAVLNFGHTSKQVHVKIDLNHFAALKTVTERIPITHDQLAFVITTYNMSGLMASKIAALFLRGKRGIGEAVYEEKGHDIYDLLWYMDRKAIPDLDYLNAKGVDVTDLRKLFDRLTLQMNKVSDENLRQDLLPLFVERTFIENWLKQWRESYLRLLDGYIRTVTEFDRVVIYYDVLAAMYSLIYWYRTEDGSSIRIVYNINDYWILDRGVDVQIEIDKKLENKVEFSSSSTNSRQDSQDKLKRYATLFLEKTEKYFKKTNRIMLGDSIITKTVRIDARNYNEKEQILLEPKQLLLCELEDLLK